MPIRRRSMLTPFHPGGALRLIVGSGMLAAIGTLALLDRAGLL